MNVVFVNPNKQSENLPLSPSPLFQAVSVSIASVRNIATQCARSAALLPLISLYLVFRRSAVASRVDLVGFGKAIAGLAG